MKQWHAIIHPDFLKNNYMIKIKIKKANNWMPTYRDSSLSGNKGHPEAQSDSLRNNIAFL